MADFQSSVVLWRKGDIEYSTVNMDIKNSRHIIIEIIHGKYRHGWVRAFSKGRPVGNIS